MIAEFNFQNEKTMSKKILRIGLLTLFMLLAGNVNAQSQHAEKIGSYITQKMSFLNMTSSQATQVYQINYQAATALERLDKEMISQKSDQEEGIRNFVKILKNRNLALQEVLSPAQFKLFQENKIERAATFRTILMAQMLDLTEDQLPEVFKINQTVVQHVRKNLDAYFSSDKNRGQKKAMNKLHKAMKKTDKAFDKVLSPQQIDIYHENADFLRSILREEYGIAN